MYTLFVGYIYIFIYLFIYLFIFILFFIFFFCICMSHCYIDEYVLLGWKDRYVMLNVLYQVCVCV